MSELTKVALLPPDMDDHPNLEFDCPHCGVAYYWNVRQEYKNAMERNTSVHTTR